MDDWDFRVGDGCPLTISDVFFGISQWIASCKIKVENEMSRNDFTKFGFIRLKVDI